MLTYTVGLLFGIGKWEGSRVHPPQIPRPWNSLRACLDIGLTRFGIEELM